MLEWRLASGATRLLHAGFPVELPVYLKVFVSSAEVFLVGSGERNYYECFELP